MTDRRKRLLAWSALAVALLLIANLLVALWHIGRVSGQTYRWLCRESGAELSYNPSVFGSARLNPPGAALPRGCKWEPVEPRPLSPFLPWNWLALILEPPPPDPEAVLRQQKLVGD
ncbi:MAG TPA: hypothetical protein VKD71_15085 [Gemmataceae bacterium]|nr:hypothetical protein [Gemmataceae bacterium]